MGILRCRKHWLCRPPPARDGRAQSWQGCSSSRPLHATSWKSETGTIATNLGVDLQPHKRCAFFVTAAAANSGNNSSSKNSNSNNRSSSNNSNSSSNSSNSNINCTLSSSGDSTSNTSSSSSSNALFQGCGILRVLDGGESGSYYANAGLRSSFLHRRFEPFWAS